MYYYPTPANLQPSTCSQEQGAGCSQTFCLDTYLSELAKSRRILETSSSNDNATGCCQGSPSGMTYAPSTGSPGADTSMSSPEDSLAKTCPPREQTTVQNKDLQEHARVFGASIKGWLAKCNLDLSLPKTPRILELTGLPESSKALPSWGIMQDGVSLEVATLVRITAGNDSGCLPTVMATDWKGGCVAIRKDRGTQRLDQWRDYVKVKYGLTYPHPTHSELRMGWPLEWTDLKPSGMDKFQRWLLSHSPCWLGVQSAATKQASAFCKAPRSAP
jgi:hypothetical protein